MGHEKTTQGLLLILTGEGKGKTTSALGMSLRAAGHDRKILFIQFIKGSWKYGEMESLKRFTDLIDFEVLGRGFTWKSDDLEKDKEAARYAWNRAKDGILSGKYSMVVLDEFTYAINYSMVDIEEVLDTLKKRPPFVHVVITGRDAPNELVELADLVTEMRNIKHPLRQGIKAQKGIEF